MLTHYIRQRTSKELESPLQSLIYQAMPEDRMVTFMDAYALLRDKCVKEELACPAQSSFAGVLNSMVKNEFIKEVIGVKLERWLEKN